MEGKSNSQPEEARKQKLNWRQLPAHEPPALKTSLTYFVQRSTPSQNFLHRHLLGIASANLQQWRMISQVRARNLRHPCRDRVGRWLLYLLGESFTCSCDFHQSQSLFFSPDSGLFLECCLKITLLAPVTSPANNLCTANGLAFTPPAGRAGPWYDTNNSNQILRPACIFMARLTSMTGSSAGTSASICSRGFAL